MKHFDMRDLTLEENGAILVPNEDGAIDIVHGGEVSPKSIGEVIHSEKVTIVDLDPETDEWVSELRDGRELCRHEIRSEVVRLEHEILAVMIANGEKIPGDNLWSAFKRSIHRTIKQFKKNG